MSELLQSGQHPDADRLSAFVEHALPRHEQEQMLAHLAICPDCRSIVSLSLPPVDEVPGLHPEPVRKSWFFGGSFVWPAAAALAGLILFMVHVHNAGVPRKIGVAPTQLAVSNPPAPLPNAATSTPATVREQSSRASEQQAQARDRRAKAAVGGSKTANQAQTGGVIESQSVAGLPAQARNLASLKNAQPKSPIEPANKLMQHSNGVVIANSVVNGGGYPSFRRRTQKISCRRMVLEVGWGI